MDLCIKVLLLLGRLQQGSLISNSILRAETDKAKKISLHNCAGAEKSYARIRSGSQQNILE
jgi:hypothetical protein